MNWMKKGPELKLSELKVPDFLFDLYYDLKERHLLPLVAVLAVAIVAVPIALSQSSESGSPGTEEEAIATPSTVQSSTSALVVAKSAPGLRDYRRRLRKARALDPFQQQYTGSAGSAGAAAAAAEAGPAPSSVSVSGEESSLSFSESSAPSTEINTGPISTGGATTVKTKYASDTIDVRIVAVGTSDDTAGQSGKQAQPQVRRDLPELTMLPDRDTPAAVFMGTSSDCKKALLLVSSDVQSIFGDGQCVVGSQTCQLLALEEGLPETFVYGPQGRTYRIEILKIEKTLSDKPQRASLGAPKKGQEAPAPSPGSTEPQSPGPSPGPENPAQGPGAG